MQRMVTPLSQQHQELNIGGRKIIRVIIQNKLIDDNLKRQIENRILHTCGSFLLTWNFQYIRNRLIVF